MRTKLIVFLIALILPLHAAASFVFNNTTSDRVDVGSGSILDNADPRTVVAWVYPTSLVANKTIWTKNPSGIIFAFRLLDTLGNIVGQQKRTVNSQCISNNTPLATLNKWYMVAWTFNSATSPTCHVYVGDLTTPVKEVTYGTQSDGSGALIDDSAEDMTWGNDTHTFTVSFTGRICKAAMYRSALTLGQLREIQYSNMQVLNPVDYHEFGYNGTASSTDFSGYRNNGTIVGSVAVAPHCPLPAPFVMAGGSSGDSLAYNPFNMDKMLALRDGFDYSVATVIKRLKFL